MSRYFDARYHDGGHSKVARRGGGYQTVDELTEQLQADVAVSAAVKGHSRERQGRKDSQSLLAPPSASSSAWNVADVIALYLRRQRYAIQKGREGGIGEEEEDEEGEDSYIDASQMRRAPSLHSRRALDRRLLESYSPKVLLLGEDAVTQELAATLRAEANSGITEKKNNSSPFVQNTSNGPHPLSSSPSTAASPHPFPEVYTIPDAVDGLDALRAELCRWCDVILLCYRVANPDSFVHLQNDVVPAVLEACAAAAAGNEEDEENSEGEGAEDGTRDVVNAGRNHSSRAGAGRAAMLSRSVDESRHSQADAWPGAMPPFILVGLGAEARLSRPTDLQAPWITNADVLSFAAEAGVQRVVELYSHSPRHVQILLQHCRTLRDVGYEGLASPAAQGRRAGLKEFGLHALLRAPPPLLELHPGTRTVHVALPPRIPTENDMVGSSSLEGGQGKGVLCFYCVNDAADALEDSAAGGFNEKSFLVPHTGVLSYADIYAAYTQTTGRPAQHAAVIVLMACTTVSYLFPSEWVQQRVPTPAVPPAGYIDVVQRCCRVVLPPTHATGIASTSLRHRTPHQQQRRQQRGAARVLWTVGDVTTCMEVPPASPSPQATGKPTTVCIPLDGARQFASGAGSALWQPWPSTAAAPAKPRVLSVVVEEDGGGEEENIEDVNAFGADDGRYGGVPTSRTSARVSTTAPVTATFVIPPVLPPPVVEYRALDRTLRLHVPGYRADQVEIRYTLDGSVPTSTTGQVYTEPVLIDTQAGASGGAGGAAGVLRGQTALRVRAVAFPRLYFASRMAEAHIDVAAASPPVQLQSDEHPGATPPVQWGSPMRSQHTPIRPLPPASPPPPPSHLAPPPHDRQRTASAASLRTPRSARDGAATRHDRRRRPSQPRLSSANSFADSDGLSVVSDAPMTRSAQLRQAFNAGLYTPPKHPFSQGEGYSSSPRSQRRSGKH